MVFMVAVTIALIWLPSTTTLGYDDASFGFACNTNRANGVGKGNNPRHRRALHRRRRDLVFRNPSSDRGRNDMMRSSSRYIECHSYENDGRHDNVATSANLRPSYVEDADKIFIVSKRAILDTSMLLMSRLRNHIGGSYRIFSSSILALSLLFAMTVPMSYAAGSPPSSSSSSLLDNVQSHHSSSSHHHNPRSSDNPRRDNPPKSTFHDELLSSSIQTRRTSRSLSSDGTIRRRGGRLESSGDRFATNTRMRPGDDYVPRRGRSVERRSENVWRISLFILAITMAASKYRASLRKSKIVRKVTPFGIIRNQSPLGNGVSVIRVRMALEFDDGDIGDDIATSRGGVDDADCLLRRLQLEERQLYPKKTMTLGFRDQMRGGGMDAYAGLGQRALADYSSNVATAFLRYDSYMKYGSLESMRVPFAEEAVREYRDISREERATYEGRNMRRTEKSTDRRGSYHYILATLLIVIKGDHTGIPPPFGIVRRRDMTRALARIAKDARVDDCLIASELIIMPDVKSVSMDERGDGIIDRGRTLTGSEILRAFPNLVPLT